jgi:hypothetical protein
MSGEPAPKVAFSGVRWSSPVAAQGASDSQQAEAQSTGEELGNRLQAILGSERLIILSGLGTSLCVRDSSGNRPAPDMAGLWTALSELDGFSEACSITATSIEQHDIETFLSRVHFALELNNEEGLRSFLKDAEQAILERCRFVNDDTDLRAHELFLRKVARRPTRLPRVQLYTTNYDLVWERAAARAGFHLVDGFGLTYPFRFEGGAFDIDFVRRRPGERPVFEPNVLQLLKLHGSVDWTSRDGEVIRDPDPDAPVLIYPAETKFELSYKRPYLECMARFQMALRDPAVAVIVLGFGFNDEHIAGPVRAAVRSNVGLRLLIVDPAAETSSNATFEFVRQMIELGDARLTMIASGLEAFVRLLPEMTAEGEREAHEQRLDQASRVIEA